MIFALICLIVWLGWTGFFILLCLAGGSKFDSDTIWTSVLFGSLTAALTAALIHAISF